MSLIEISQTDFANVYSQNGEDGIIAKILETLEIKQGWVCEFGAWDGKFLSNTFALINKGFQGVFIEGHPDRFQDLLKTCYSYPNIVPLLAYVDPNPNTTSCLDRLLFRTPLKPDNFFVLLSIDVDGCDYQIWESLSLYQPIIVVIEINSSLLPERTLIHGQEDPIQHRTIEGSSFSAMLELGHRKGYQFLCHTGNIIFIHNHFASKFAIPPNPMDCFQRKWLA